MLYHGSAFEIATRMSSPGFYIFLALVLMCKRVEKLFSRT